MHRRYLEYIVVYLSVLIACALLGIIARIFFLSIGIDEFTSNIIFWVVFALGFLSYAILTLLVEGVFSATAKRFFPQKEVEQKQKEKPIKPKNFSQIRTEQKLLRDKKLEDKQNIVIEYIQEKFALYTSDKDLRLLCQYVILYANKQPLENIQPITVQELTTLDLYHFGWNIWKHFGVSKQDEIASLLKNVFPHLLKDIEVDSIKSHLKDDELKGIIKIEYPIVPQN